MNDIPIQYVFAPGPGSTWMAGYAWLRGGNYSSGIYADSYTERMARNGAFLKTKEEGDDRDEMPEMQERECER